MLCFVNAVDKIISQKKNQYSFIKGTKIDL